ncbi:MAG: cytochrome bc complex cytochrome b subunit [Planctomycetes bacterium]|nr:cytochrome bc complex cytochrome b subunit [Planctomycetota bacterium]
MSTEHEATPSHSQPKLSEHVLPGGLFGRLSALDEPLPHSMKRWFWCWGSLPGFFFMIQVTTGIMLAFFYKPAVETAFESVRYITEEVRYGWFIRSIHMWSAQMMIIFVFLHATRVLITGAYRGKGRWLTWMVGFSLLVSTLMFAFTGYTLIYEQLSYWGVTVAANINSYVPIVGPYLADFIRYGTEVGDITVSRMFAFHVFIFPPALCGLIGIHIFCVRKFGVHIPGNENDISIEQQIQKQKGPYHFFPQHALAELVVFLYLGLVTILLAIAFPAQMHDPANPLVTPEHIKPEWYFYATFRWLKLFPAQIGIILLGGLVGVIFCWPFVDRFLRKLSPKVEIGLWASSAAILVILIMTVIEAIA